MFAIRQIIEDPQDSIPVPPEVRHQSTEVIFIRLDPDKIQTPPRAGWFDGYQPEQDVEAWESLPMDEGPEEWER